MSTQACGDRNIICYVCVLISAEMLIASILGAPQKRLPSKHLTPAGEKSCDYNQLRGAELLPEFWDHFYSPTGTI